MSAQDLSDACKALNFSFSRSAIANFESGRRPTISVAELTVLGKALDVPPIELVFPVGRQEEAEVLPGQELPPWVALKWFAGEDSFGKRFPDDGKIYGQNEEEFQESATFAFRWHETYTKQCMDAANAAKAARKAAGAAETEGEKNGHLAHARSEDAQFRMCRKLLQEHRADMRRRGLTPPGLWGVLADVDGMAEGG
jgi:transcriptional regulator with XRE-family HTH domain